MKFKYYLGIHNLKTAKSIFYPARIIAIIFVLNIILISAISFLFLHNDTYVNLSTTEKNTYINIAKDIWENGFLSYNLENVSIEGADSQISTLIGNGFGIKDCISHFDKITLKIKDSEFYSIKISKNTVNFLFKGASEFNVIFKNDVITYKAIPELNMPTCIFLCILSGFIANSIILIIIAFILGILRYEYLPEFYTKKEVNEILAKYK